MLYSMGASYSERPRTPSKERLLATIGDSDPACYVHLGEGEYYSFLCPCSAQVFAAFGERDYRIVWRVESSNESGLRCPLSPFPDWAMPTMSFNCM